MSMLELKEISLEDEQAFSEFEKRYKKECGTEKIPYSLNPKNLNYKEFLRELEACKCKETLPKGFVLARYYLIMVDDRIVGGINLRLETNDFILNYAGHIGYGIAPWERNRGYAQKALKKVLVLAKDIGMSDLLLTVDLDNIASQKVILSCGGKFEKEDENKFFYWIHLKDWRQEESAMAIVFWEDKILATKELIYDKEIISCPKGHIEIGETHLDAAIRECFEETGVVLNERDFKFECLPFIVKFMDPHLNLICKTIYPLVFHIDEFRKGQIQEERIIAIDYIPINKFIEDCSYDNVRYIVKQAI